MNEWVFIGVESSLLSVYVKWRLVSHVMVKALTSNYAFKPTAEQALRIDRGAACRGGLTRR